MSTIIEAPKSNFKPHPEGTFLAVMADCWLETKDNPWKGTVNKEGREDTRPTITEVSLAFLTDELVDVGGQMKPGYVRYRATASVAENSNLRKFLKGWFPKLQDADFERFDADKLIGRGVYLTVAHRESKGNIYANVVNAAAPPKGAAVPEIPADFVRRKDKPQEAPVANVTSDPPASYSTPIGATATDEAEDDGLPF
jgi:hypothetical protein